MASSSNPITSVPDPSQSSAFASVITQVQPGQVTAARPVRPKKVAKSTSEGDAAKKKKKRRQGAPELAAQAGTSIRATGGAAASSQEAAVRAAAAAGSSDALRQAHGANAVRNDIATSTEGTTTTQHLAGGENDVVVEHSHQPSSTLVEGSTAGNTLTNPEAPSTAAPAVVTSGPGQDLDRAAEKLASESSDGTVEKQGLVAVPGTTSSSADVRRTNTVATAKPVQAATTSASGPSQRPAGHREKPRQKKPGFAQRVIALITCSSGAASMAQEDLNEKTGSHSQGQSARSRTTGKSGSESLPTKVMVPPRTPTSKGGSRLGGEDANSSLGPTTPGGGTKLPREETGDVMSGAVVPPGAAFVAPGDFSGADACLGLGAAGTTAAQHRKSRASGDASKTESEIDEDYDDDDDEDEDDDLDLEDEFMDDDQTEEQRLIMQGGMGIPVDEFGNPQPLLGPIVREDLGRKCLVLDLDETLVHSSFKVMPADFIVPVEIEGTVHNVYVIKRPGVDEFMRRMGEIYEVVVFTASLSKYADPVLDMLDIHHAVRHRLFRESCYNHKGNYVKDLSQLGRDIGDTIIIDNSPASYIFHPNNAVPISSWFNDPHDTELTDLCPFLADLCEVDDVRAALDGGLF